MGMSGGGHKGGVQSEINVTPLIDVLLVLLIIFLVVMPVMMKMETLQVPRKIDDQNEMPDPNSSMLVVKVLKGDQQMVFIENEKETPIAASDLLRTLRPKLEAIGARGGTEKVVFVDFEDEVSWGTVITTMDSIRSLAADLENHDEIKVALKIKEAKDKLTQ
ncbi:MAG: biopolymer transporter ExbD [Proteobacteria bacterium]|nr:biopolymer transporter ExbD [Pseudomonadota bacterium]